MWFIFISTCRIGWNANGSTEKTIFAYFAEKRMNKWTRVLFLSNKFFHFILYKETVETRYHAFFKIFDIFSNGLLPKHPSARILVWAKVCVCIHAFGDTLFKACNNNQTVNTHSISISSKKERRKCLKDMWILFFSLLLSYAIQASKLLCHLHKLLYLWLSVFTAPKIWLHRPFSCVIFIFMFASPAYFFSLVVFATLTFWTAVLAHAVIKLSYFLTHSLTLLGYVYGIMGKISSKRKISTCVFLPIENRESLLHHVEVYHQNFDGTVMSKVINSISELYRINVYTHDKSKVNSLACACVCLVGRCICIYIYIYAVTPWHAVVLCVVCTNKYNHAMK